MFVCLTECVRSHTYVFVSATTKALNLSKRVCQLNKFKSLQNEDVPAKAGGDRKRWSREGLDVIFTCHVAVSTF